MVKKLLAFLFLSIPLFGQLVDLTQTKGTLPTARLITGTITPLACLGLSADGLTVISVACGGGGGGTITGSGTANKITKWTSGTAIGNSSLTDSGTTLAGTLPMSNTTTGQTVSYTLPSSGGAATANFLVIDTNTATSGTDRGFSVAKTWNPSGSSTEGGRAVDISWTVPSSNSQSFTNLALSGLNIHGVFSGTGTLSGGCLTCGVHAILAENYTASGNAIVVDAISLFNGPTTGFSGTTSNNDGLFVRSGAFGTAAGTISSNTGITVSAACAQSGATPTTTCTNSYGIFLTPMGAISGSNPNPWQIFDNSAGAGMAASSANKSQLGQVFANSYDIYGTTSGSVSLQPSSAVASGTISVPNGTGTLLVTHAANTGAAGMTLNMSASTSAASLRVPNIAGASSTTAGVVSYDTTNKNFHAGANGVDNFVALLPSSISPANNDCAKFTVAAGVVTLNTAGAACGSGAGGVTSLSGDGTIITNSASTGAVTLTIAGTSGGVPYFNSTSAWTSSALLTSNSPMLGGGAGNPPKTVAGITSDGTSAVTFGVQNTSQGKLTVAGSAAANGQLVLNIAGASANALTITPGANAGGVTLTGPTTGGTIPSAATAPVTLSAAGAIACATCATTTNGGAISGTAPVAVSAAGAISITGAAGQVLAGAGPAFTATPTLGVQNTTQGTLTVAGSAAANGQLILNIAGASANALTITPGANAGGVTLTGPTTGGTIPSAATSPITLSAAGAIACATCVVNNAANTGTTAMTLDMSASTTANALKVPVGAGLTSGANGAIAYDSTAGLTHQRTAGADSISMASTTTSTTTTQAVFATGTAGIYGARAIATGDLPNIPLNQVISPTGAVATFASGDNALTFNSASTTSGRNSVTFGETTASTSAATPSIVLIQTSNTSTARPLTITQGTGVNATDNVLALSVAGGVGGTNAGATSPGKKGGGVTFTTGAGSNAGATSGTGGAGGDINLTAGNGGTAAVASTTGAGGNIILTPGSAGGTGTAGAQGNVQVVGGTVGAALTGSFVNVLGTWNTTGVVDAALFVNITNSASGAASKLADFQIGSASQWNVDKAGNSIQLGSVTAGSGAATAGALVLGQGTTQSTGTTNITIQAPTSVTSHVLTLPGVKATNNNSAMLFSNAAPSVATYAKMQQTAITTGTAYSNATTTFSDVKGSTGQTLSFSVEASTNYVAHCFIHWQGSATTTGPKFQFTGPASPTNVSASMFSSVTATTFINAAATAFSSSMPNTGTITATTNFVAYVDLGLVNGVNAGTVTLQAAANGVGTLTINDGSFCVLQ